MQAWMQEPAQPGSLHQERPGRWIAEASWPPASVEPRLLYLGGEGVLTGAASAEGRLRHTGAQTHGLQAGLWCPYGPATDFPGDQRDEDALCLTFDTPPLDERVELFGYPRWHATLAVDRPLAFVVARLCDVAPDGTSTLLSRGALNLTHRDGHERPTALTPGRRYEVEVELDVMGQAVSVGHRLRLAVSTTYWPWLWPSPEPVELTLSTGEGSWLELPVRSPDAGDGPVHPFGPAVTAPPMRAEERRSTVPFREIDRDASTGEVVLTIDPDGDSDVVLSGGPAMTHRSRDRFTIREGDPLSARVECDRTVGLRRDGWSVEVRTHSEMTADATRFHLVDTVEASEDGVRVFERTWRRSVARDLV
jgi:hypothetical protein